MFTEPWDKYELCDLEQVSFPMPRFTQRKVLSFMVYRYSRQEPRDNTIRSSLRDTDPTIP